MADYTQNQDRPNIKPTPVPPPISRGTVNINPPSRSGSGVVPALGAVAVVGIVALVAWGVMNNDANDNAGQQAPVAVQPAAEPAAPMTPADPVVPAKPDPISEPAPTPQEVPVPAPEAPVAPVPVPAPAPTN